MLGYVDQLAWYPMRGSDLMQQIWLAARLLLRSFCMGCRHQGTLNLTAREHLRLTRKTFRLAWCYSAFVPKNHPRRVRGATEAAFASAVYDVLTDWNGINIENRETLRQVLLQFVSPNLCKIATGLYEKEMTGSLESHGLDRGVDALRFVLDVFGVSVGEVNGYSIEEAGYALQAIDDLLDYESDVRCGDINFLTSSHREQVLGNLNNWISHLPIQIWCERSFAFRIALRRALDKARQLKQESLPGQTNSIHDAA